MHPVRAGVNHRPVCHAPVSAANTVRAIADEGAASNYDVAEVFHLNYIY
jgi:hypothetical protein